MPKNVVIELSSFASNFVLDMSAQMYSTGNGNITADATTSLYVKTSDIKQVFLFQSDAAEIISNPQLIRFYVNSKAWENGIVGNINPADSVVQTGSIITTSLDGTPYPQNKMFVCHDYLRYLSVSLFNTPYGVDLFENINPLLQDIRDKCNDNVWSFQVNSSIKNSLSAVDMTAPNHDQSFTLPMFQDVNGLYYTTAGDNDPTNIGRLIAEEIMTAAPERFVVPTIQNTDQPQSVPFQDGDRLIFSIGINPAMTQEKLTLLNTPIQIRTYLIQLILTADGINIPIAHDEIAYQQSI